MDLLVLDGADAMICVVTSAYKASHWCMYEVTTARIWGCKLLPLYTEPGITYPLLTKFQHTYLTKDRDPARLNLIEALHRIDAGWPADPAVGVSVETGRITGGAASAWLTLPRTSGWP